MSTPQVRSRELLADEGYLVATVESIKRFPPKDPAKRVPCRACGHAPLVEIKVDLWNCFDLIAEHPQKQERIYVQVTSAANHATRRNKVLSSFEAKLVLLAGRWTIREEEITLKHFQQAFAYPNTVKALQEIRRKAKKPDLPPGTSLPFSPILDSDTTF